MQAAGVHSMATVLLIIIYIAFIGLGIPDSLFGTAWPAIYSDFGLPFSFGSFVTVIVSCGTVISSIISSKVIAKLGTNKVSAYSTLLTAIALLGYSFAPNLWVMCFLSVILGIGAGSIDVALNNYVALHYSATHMSSALLLRRRRIRKPLHFITCYCRQIRLARRIQNYFYHSACHSCAVVYIASFMA